MSRRRGPRGRQRNTTSDNSQRILQIALIGAGILFLLIGAIIATGIDLPGTGAPSGGDNNAPSAGGQTPPSPTTEQPQTQTKRSTQTTDRSSPTETTSQPSPTATTTTTPPTTQQTRTATSGGIQFVKTTDKNGNGYVSDFDILVVADTRLKGTDPGGDGTPYYVVTINGEPFGETKPGDIDRRKNNRLELDVKSEWLERKYQRGPLQVTVKLMDADPGSDEEIQSWTKTVQYEPE